MIKKLLFASMLTIFSVLSTMAQTPPYDVFIGTTNTLFYEWSKGPDFKWNGTSKDSIGAVTSFTPYEGADHYEFNYNITGWWGSGAWVLDTYDEVAGSYPGKVDLSAYTHLRLYYKGFSAGNPRNVMKWHFSDATGNGPEVIVFDSCNNGTYVEKLIPLTDFLGIVPDGSDPDALDDDTLTSLAAIEHITWSVADGDNTWWMTGGATQGVWYMDAVQFVDMSGSTGVSHSTGSSDTYASYPSPFTDETVIKVNSTVNAPMSIKVMDTKGTVVSTSEGHFTNEEIALGKGLEKGIYFVQAAYQNRMQVIKIVKM
jgi:hypothetical protein